ncbi:MAG: Holliday junction branch migration protein RuvA [Rhodospirillales bacterium]|nr:Holliday junction branch migration protein RuvA [Rhodospirillales bacterium]
MIAKLTGRIDSLGRDFAVIDVGGVGYLVFCSGRTLGRIAVGSAVSVLVETHVREDHIHLYGFIDAVERDWFRVLTTVQGVGAKLGLAILSTLDADALFTAVAAGDRAALSRAPGVGPKLAGRIASELKEKIAALPQTLEIREAPVAGRVQQPVASGSGVPITDAVSALVNLGFGASEALVAVSRAASELGTEASVETLIRSGLKGLAPREHPAA